MAWEFRVLVVANVTADSPELIEALTERAARNPCRFTLLVPAAVAGRAGREAAAARLGAALAAMEAAGLQADGAVGGNDPVGAVDDIWNPGRFDEVVVSTLPTGSSKWLHADLPRRVAKITDAAVKHVVAQPPRPAPRTSHPREEPERLGMLSPFGALTGGRPRSSRD